MNPDDKIRIALGVGAVGAALAMLAGLFGLHDGSLWRAPRYLHTQVESALRAQGLTQLEVEMNGQLAVLRGVVQTDQQRDRAYQTALGAAGSGGIWAGGVTGVDSRAITVAPMEQPFIWRAWRDGSSVVLEGAVPSQGAMDSLVGDANALFTPQRAVVLNRMRVAGGAPSANWTEVARTALRQLAVLDGGEMRMEDATLTFEGRAPTPAVAAAVRAQIQALPPPFDNPDIILPEE